ncbi:MAG: hypothetical protein KDJ81_02565, partial [Rhodobacteraceae bacterium]|nr:hypothetical protein [Paracoccaceae bacterium]
MYDATHHEYEFMSRRSIVNGCSAKKPEKSDWAKMPTNFRADARIRAGSYRIDRENRMELRANLGGMR